MKVNLPLDETTFIITSDVPWSHKDTLQQAIALELSKYSKVIFLNPPVLWKPSSGFAGTKHTFRENNNLVIIPYQHLFPVRFFTGFFTYLNDYFTTRRIKKYLGPGSLVIYWRTDKFRLVKSTVGRKSFAIYHVISSGLGKAYDLELAVNSDLVVCIHKKDLDEYLNYNIQSILVPPALIKDTTLTNDSSISVPDSDYLMITGDINSGFDIGMMIKMAIDFPALMFIICGTVCLKSREDVDQLVEFQSLPNVKFVGTLSDSHYNEMLKNATMFCLPFRVVTENDLYKFPIILPLYLSARKPIISTVDPMIKNQDKVGFLLVSSDSEIKENINKILERRVSIDNEYAGQLLKEFDMKGQMNVILNKINSSLN